jgi:hypothetical protein
MPVDALVMVCLWRLKESLLAYVGTPISFAVHCSAVAHKKMFAGTWWSGLEPYTSTKFHVFQLSLYIVLWIQIRILVFEG